MKKFFIAIAALMLISTVAFGQVSMNLLIQNYLPQGSEKLAISPEITVSCKWIMADGTVYTQYTTVGNAPKDGTDIFHQVPFSGPAAQVFNVVKTCGSVTVKIPNKMNCTRAICKPNGFEYSKVLNHWVDGQGEICTYCDNAVDQ